MFVSLGVSSYFSETAWQLVTDFMEDGLIPCHSNLALRIGEFFLGFSGDETWLCPAYWDYYRTIDASVHRYIHFTRVRKISCPNFPPQAVFQLDGPLDKGFPLFGKIWLQEKEHCISFEAPDSSEILIQFSRLNSNWKMEYTASQLLIIPPLDQFLFFLFIAAQHGFLIHAAAVIHQGYGFLFPGISGTGKSTLARFFQEEGAIVIDDDRIGLLPGSNGIRMFSLPSFYSEKYSEGLLNGIIFPKQGKETYLRPQGKARSIIQSCASMVSHPVFPEMQHNFARLVSTFLTNIKFFELEFALKPNTVIEMMELVKKSGQTPINFIFPNEQG